MPGRSSREEASTCGSVAEESKSSPSGAKSLLTHQGPRENRSLLSQHHLWLPATCSPALQVWAIRTCVTHPGLQAAIVNGVALSLPLAESISTQWVSNGDAGIKNPVIVPTQNPHSAVHCAGKLEMLPSGLWG